MQTNVLSPQLKVSLPEWVMGQDLGVLGSRTGEQAVV